MIVSKTLLIRHLPPDLSEDEKEDLLKHFGAINVKILSSKHKKNNVAFARFPSETQARIALHRLHQLDVLGSALTVEFAKADANKDSLPEKKHIFHSLRDEKENCRKHYETFLHKLNTWYSGVNFTQPPPAHLRYQYPPPTHAVLTNITRALGAVPKFYTQVLHLMNKMNLPSPFENIIFPECDVPDGYIKATQEISKAETAKTLEIPEEELNEESEDEESEIESDNEEGSVMVNVIPIKRVLPQTKRKVKRPKFLKPLASGAALTSLTAKTLTKPEEVFEKVECEPVQRKIELKLTSGGTSEGTEKGKNVVEKDSVLDNSGGFGLMFPAHKDTSKEDISESETEEGDITKSSTISAEELAANRISTRDQKHLPVFRNYQPGIPSCRLYIKNLAKQVVERDLHFIYRRYLISDYEEQGSMFDIRLMKEGRMKGQAFITLQNTRQAQLALQETNGYILKDKPLVVQFARSAKAKEKP